MCNPARSLECPKLLPDVLPKPWLSQEDAFHITSSGRRRSRRECLVGRPRPLSLRGVGEGNGERTRVASPPQGACRATDREPEPRRLVEDAPRRRRRCLHTGAACRRAGRRPSVSRPFYAVSVCWCGNWFGARVRLYWPFLSNADAVQNIQYERMSGPERTSKPFGRPQSLRSKCEDQQFFCSLSAGRRSRWCRQPQWVLLAPAA